MNIVLSLFLIAGSLASNGASSDPPSKGAEIFAHAISTMHHITTAPFLEYHYAYIASHKSKVRRWEYWVKERTSDHLGRFEGTHPDGSLTGDVHLENVLVPPDLFLGSSKGDSQNTKASYAPTPTPSPSVATIGDVFVTNYNVTLIGNEDTTSCPQAFKLNLIPKSEPDRFYLRTLWVDRGTYRICRAAIFRSLYIITLEPTIIFLDIDQQGYVKHWNFEGTGHLIVMPYSIVAEGWYDELKPVANLDAKLFK